MQRDKLTGLQAFATLTRASKDTNIKLVDVARWLVEEHESALATGDCRVRGLASKSRAIRLLDVCIRMRRETRYEG